MINDMIQYQMANSKWHDCADRTDEFIAKSVAYGFSADSTEAAIEKLNAGQEIKWDCDWYARLRIKPAATAAPIPELVKCDCGHAVSRILVMRSCMGTSCPDCYDND